MSNLLKYYNSLSYEERKKFCLSVGISDTYLRSRVSCGRPFNPRICAQMEKHSNGEITRQELRPNDWQEIWLELN